jgi:ABC-type multidrug transport system ATPase subunit
MRALEVHGLTKRYGKTLAVDDVTFAVQAGQIFGFLGPNGSGKTTTIGMIFDVINPTAGTISVLGRSNREALAERRLGGTLEQPNLYPYMTGHDNLRIVAAVKGLDKKHIEPALKAVDLLDAAHRVVNGYSLGMKQRLGLAAAMLGEPEFLIFDEPTNGLDPDGMREIRELILSLARAGRTVFLSTHLLDEVEKICTHVAILNRGRLQRAGKVTDFTSGSASLRLRAEDLTQLLNAVSQFEFAKNVRTSENAVCLDLTSGNPASLNRYLTERGIYLNELSSQRERLEQAFLSLTEEEQPKDRERSLDV